MKRFVVIVLAVLLIFGIVASIVSSTQKAPQPEAPAPTDAAAPAPDAPTGTTAEPVVIRSLDEDAIRALRAPDEVVLSLDGETVSWEEYCQWLFSTGRQIEDYFRQMASFYGLAADWEGSVGDGSGMTYAQYAVHETNENLSNILAYRRFAAGEQISLSEDQQAQLTDEALAKALLGENATVEQLTAELEKEGFSIETFFVDKAPGSAAHGVFCGTQYGGWGFALRATGVPYFIVGEDSYNHYVSVDASSASSTTELTHVVCVYDPAARKMLLYINGVLNASNASISGSFYPGAAPCFNRFCLGADTSGGAPEFPCTDMVITDAKWYVGALDATVVQAAYQAAVKSLNP